ncbi:interferon-induced very large GTPase 1-like, partial [Ruditapes philippinarum]|uniref:interferon-induced very large GTPase 1-like n=1 Tax=Ruditapes philippinarum TaxID=129788 RepID=UPI00295B5018
MGVDIQTYRCRIGTFRSLQGFDVKTLSCCVNYSRGLKIVGSVAFIGILLLIAGVESNPGPLTTEKCTCSAHKTKIKVSGLPTNVDEEDLENLFENEKRQGGGSVKQITMFPNKAIAIVEFEEEEAVEKVLKKRPINIKKKTVDIEPYHTPYTLKLKGPQITWTSIDKPSECLEKSYGEVSCITFSSEEIGAMFVTFKDEKVANELVIKGELSVEEVTFTAVFHSPEKKIHDDDKFADVDCIKSDVDDKDKDTGHDEDRLFPYEQFIKTLGLVDYYPDKINISCVMTIDIENGSMFDRDQTKIELTELPWILLRSLLGVYCKARDRVASLIYERSGSQGQFTSDWLFTESYDDTEINPLDLFITVYKCCDPMLKQLLFQKCYSCKIAVPFIHVLHDFSSLSSRSVVSIWPLRCLFIQNRYVTNEGKRNLSVEEGVYEHPTNLITFARIGKTDNSKSEMLNWLLSDNNCKTFFDKNCARQMTSHKYSEGLVEIFWLPIDGNSMDRFNNPVTFLNCRGSLHHFQKEVLDFVSKLTDIMVVLLDIESLHGTSKWCTDDYVSKFSSMIIIIDNPMIRKNESIVNTFRSKMQSQRKICEIISTYQCERKLNPIEMTGLLQQKLQSLLIKIHLLSLNDRIKSLSQNIDLDEDSDSCKNGKKRARNIIEEMMKAGNSLKWKTIITPVQTTISNRIAPLIKQQQRLQYETEIKDIDEKLLSLRHSCLDNVTSTVQKFASYLCETHTCELSLQFFLGWLNIMLANKKMSTVRELQTQCNLDIDRLKSSDLLVINVKQEVDSLLKETEDNIEKSSFSIEHLLREINHIYNVCLILKRETSLPPVDKMKTTLANLIYIGYTFELVDGDNFFLPTHWVEEILQSLSFKIDNKSFLTLSVLGLQSSGKSTLLNTMFGSHFAASSGRCTKGLNLKLIPMSQRITKCNFRYVLVVDTEGLRATELYDCKMAHDNELSTFITGLGDVTLLNVMGENICEINDILNVTVHAFIRLKKANKSLDIRKSCYFVHQNVSGILSARNTRPGLRKLVQKLNNATKDAAQLENVPNISEFNEIMEFNMDSQVFYMPTLWQGNSPMTFVNCEYSQHVNFVKSEVLHGACEMTNKSYKSLSDLVIHMKDLWTGVLSEDFVFSFRNNIEIKAYIHLNEYFKQKHSIIERQIYDKCCVSAQKSFSRSVDKKQLDFDFDNAKTFTNKTIDNEEENWKVEMDDFLRQSSYSEEQVHWKGMTMTRIASTCLDLKYNISLELSALYDNRAVEILTTMDKTHEDKLIKKSWNLAKQLKGNFTPEIIDKKFETIWTNIASQSLTRSSGESKLIDIKKIIYNCLNKLFDQDKPLLKKFLDKRGENTVTITLQDSFENLCLDTSDVKRKNHILTKDKKESIKESIDILFDRIDDILTQQRKNKNKITGSGVTRFFEEVEEYYASFEKQHAEDFSFTISLKMKIFIQIAECAGNIFEMHNTNYEMNFGPEARRKQYKQKMKNIFMSFVHDRKADETAASEFSYSVKSSVRDSVIKVLSREVKVALCSHIGSMKYHFITNLLTDLLSMNDYKSFSEYNHNPKLFAAQWITTRSNTFLFCQPSRKYYSMACSYIKEYFEDVKGSVVKTAEIFSKRSTSDCETVEISSPSDDWIDTLSSNLQKCTLSNSQFNLLKNILRQKIEKELIIRNLDESEHKLKEEFEKVDSTTVTWNISERLDPITEVIKETWGCPDECPFCGEPCARDIHDAEKMPHFCIQHKPKGCKRIHLLVSKQLSITTCNFAVSSSDLTHTCSVFDYACKSDTKKTSCPLEKHRYRDYKKFIKSWDIEPNTDINAVCKFWMLYLSRFAKDITKDTDIEISNIPASWQDISDKDATESLRKLYT